MVAPVSGTRSQQDHARHVALLGFVIGLALIVLLAVLGIGNAREASDAVARVESSHTAIEAIEAISARLGEAKSARRAYGLTGEATYRQIYKQAVAALSEGMLLIARLTADHPTLHGALVELAPVVTQRLARLEDQNLAREATGKEVLPTDTIAVENGKLDDTIRRLTTTMIAEERSLLETREQASRDRLGRGEIVGGIGAASACILLLLAFGLLSREVLQRRRAEAATRKALVATEALNSELEAFSYSVSHDLRAPLRAIDGFSQALLEDNAAQLDEGGKHHLDRVRSASQRMAQLIDDLLGLSRVTRSPLRSEGLELSELAEAALVDLREANRDRQVEVAIEGGLTAHGDPRLLRIVFDNLLGNAFKFTAKRPHAHIEVGARIEKGEYVYFVRDDGIGFDPQYAEKLFGAFQRLHDGREFAGTGIGLATVQRIVRRHGGRIWASSEPEHGATFSFTLGFPESGEMNVR